MLRTEGMSLEGRGSDGENVLFEPIINLETSSELVGENDERGRGGLGGRISAEKEGVMEERILSIF